MMQNISLRAHTESTTDGLRQVEDKATGIGSTTCVVDTGLKGLITQWYYGDTHLWASYWDKAG